MIIIQEHPSFLFFLPPDQGGRKNLLQGPWYHTVVQFPGIDLRPNSWSFVINFESMICQYGTINVRVKFLSEEAPHNLLIPGRVFNLLEGERIVAIGQIL